MTTIAISTPRMNSTLFCTIVIFLMVTALMAMNLYLPSLPMMAEKFGTSMQTVQQSLTIFLLSFGLSQIFYGILSDSYGRRPFLLFGFSVYLVGSVVTISASNIDMLLLGRLLQGVGAGAGATLFRTLMRDYFADSELAEKMALVAPFMGAAPAVAMVIGGFLQQYSGFHASFVFLLMLGVITFVMVYYFLPETLPHHARQPLRKNTVLKNLKTIFSNQVFLSNMLLTGFMFSVLIIFSDINPYLLQIKLHLSASMYGIITLFIAGGMPIGSFIASRLIKQHAGEKIIFIGVSLVMLAGLMLALTNMLNILTITSVAAPTFLAAIGIGIVFPMVAANAFIPFPKIAGTVGAAYGSMQMLISSAASFLVASLNLQSPLSMGIAFIIIASIGFGLLKLDVAAK